MRIDELVDPALYEQIDLPQKRSVGGVMGPAPAWLVETVAAAGQDYSAVGRDVDVVEQA